MIKLLLQTTSLIQDEDFDEAIKLEGSFKRVRTDMFPIEETLVAVSSENIQNILCFANIIDNYSLIERIVLESKAFQKNLYLIISKTDFDASSSNKKEWLVSNSDEIYDVSQHNNETALKKISIKTDTYC